MEYKHSASGNLPLRILILSGILAAVVSMTSYLSRYITDIYITGGLAAIMCMYFFSVLAAAQNDSVYKLLVTIFLTIIFILAFAIWANISGAVKHFQSHEAMAAWIKSLHGAAEFAYIGFHIIQVLFLPIPGVISIVAGTMLFGAFKSATLSLVGVMIGCVIMFGAGRLFGKRLANWIAGKEAVDKYLNIISGKDKVMLTAMFILPFFPDDLLCMIAGLTTMSFRYFIVMTLLTRIVALYTTAYLGSGEIIPYHGWGLAAWGLLILGVSILLVLLWRKGDKLQTYVSKMLKNDGARHKNKGS